MERYTQLTRHKITMSQEPAPDLVSNQLKAALSLIKMGRLYHRQDMIDRGWEMIVKIWMNNWKALEVLTPDDAALLMKTRARFWHRIKAVNNGRP